MKTVQKSVLIWYSAEEMFALVIDVERYPDFLPWCDKGRVLERTDHGMLAESALRSKVCGRCSPPATSMCRGAR